MSYYEYAVAILVDLTKAVECFRHKLLLCKLRTFEQIIYIYLILSNLGNDSGLRPDASHRPSLDVIVRLFTLLTNCSNLSYGHNVEVKHKVSPVTGLGLKSHLTRFLLSENQNSTHRAWC